MNRRTRCGAECGFARSDDRYAAVPPHLCDGLQSMTSALAKRLMTYLDLTTTEGEILEGLEHRTRTLEHGEVLAREGERTDQLFIVVEGWMHASLRLTDGARQILSLHFPGDLIGLSTLAWNRAATTLTAVSEARVATFAQGELTNVFRSHPRLSALLYTVAAAEQVAFSDRLASLGQTDARARVAALFLDILSRLRVGMPQSVTGSRFDLHLTQTEIGAATGLTKVHVNRTLRRMEEEGLIARDGRIVEVLRESELGTIAAFRDRLSRISTDWLPTPTPRSYTPAAEPMMVK